MRTQIRDRPIARHADVEEVVPNQPDGDAVHPYPGARRAHTGYRPATYTFAHETLEPDRASFRRRPIVAVRPGSTSPSCPREQYMKS